MVSEGGGGVKAHGAPVLSLAAGRDKGPVEIIDLSLPG